MNEIIKNIEAAQLKENVPSFNVGDTVKVYNKIKGGRADSGPSYPYQQSEGNNNRRRNHPDSDR